MTWLSKLKTSNSKAKLFDAGKSTRANLRELGHSLREKVPRSSHEEWQPHAHRPDPVDVLREQEAGRLEELIPIRYGRMLKSPFAFYRGAAAIMAWDLAQTPTTGICVQACGDAHLLNFGGYASPERQVVFDINDFDETIPAPWEYDVKRLATSVLLGAREQGCPDNTGLRLVRATVRRYCDVLSELSELTSLDIHYAHVESRRLLDNTDDPDVANAIRKYIKKAQGRTNIQAFRKFVTQTRGGLQFVEDPPLLVRCPPKTIDFFHELFDSYRETLPDDRRLLISQYRFRDAAKKVVGVGSVGLGAYVVLLEGLGDPDPLVIQIKEAVSSVLSPYVGHSGCERNGERVFVGQRRMQAVSDPFLGWAPFAERDFYMRQLRDMKGSGDIPQNIPALEAYGSLCGGTLARAHARTVDPALLSSYLGKGKSFVKAITMFARIYADQTEADHARLVKAWKGCEISAMDR